MKKPTETTVRAVLKAVRSLANGSAVHMLSGRRVADLVPPFDGERSLARKVGDMTGFAMGTADHCLRILVKAGLLESGMPGGGRARWVRLDGDFSYLSD